MTAVATTTALDFRAMGSPCRAVVGGGAPDLTQRCCQLVESLEQRWSRFLASSEVSALNRAAGSITIVSPETFRLLEVARASHELTDGWFNPLMLDQLENHGYRYSWDPARPPSPTVKAITPASAESIALYSEISAVRLPSNTRFDPGGIGKGLAIDLAVELCIGEGATTVSIELGGDVRVHGEPWYGDTWRIGVESPFAPTEEVAAFTPSSGAVTTSTTVRRRWHSDGRVLHHLLDPFTGSPSSSDIVSVTTCSSTAWWAEVAAKTTLLVGSERAMGFLSNLDTPGIAITADGRIHRSDRSASVQTASTRVACHPEFETQRSGR